MTQVKLVKVRIKDKETWVAWCNELKKRKKEVIATLEDEGVVSESFFISSDGKEGYYFMEAKDFEKAKAVALKSKHAIDKDHKKAKEASLERVELLEPLFHFNKR